jgi:hypothetical protein
MKTSINQEATMAKKWFEAIETQIAKAQEAGEETGACLLPNPNGGPQHCEDGFDQATCENLGGVFIGGICGGTEEAKFRKSQKRK